MAARKTSDEQTICDAALRLAAGQSWNTLTLAAIARAAGMPLSRLEKTFKTPNAILLAIVERHDGEVAAVLGRSRTNGRHASSLHDRLFDGLMIRLDLLQRHRPAFLALLRDLRRDPASGCVLAARLFRSMRTLLKNAAPEPGGFRQPFAAAGLLAIYLNALRIWQEDDSPDLAKTMARLDRDLRRAGKAATLLSASPDCIKMHVKRRGN